MTKPVQRPLRRIQLIAIASILAIVAAACGGGSDGGGGETAATSEAPAETLAPATTAAEAATTTTTEAVVEEELEPLTASWRGVTEDEIHIGMSMLDFEALMSFNLSTQGWGDQIAVYQAFIDDINDRGGIHGRMVVGHFEHYSPLGSTEAEAACVTLTQDVETFAILSGFLGPAEVANNCIVETNETILIGGRQTAERLAAAKAPWVDTPELRNRRLPLFLNLLKQTGNLDGDPNVAVIGSLEQEDIFDIAGDAFRDAGIEPVLEALNDVPQGDTVASDARWAVLAENIKASGADHVMVIGSTQAAVRGIKDNGLDVVVWVLESTGLENLGAESTPEDAEGAITIVSLTDQQEWDSPTVTRCRDIVSAAIPDAELKSPEESVEGDEQWFNSIPNYCRNMFIFETLMTAAGRNPTHESFQAAIDNLGDIELPGRPFASGGKPDWNDTFQLAVFDQTMGDLGGLVPISDLFDGTP